MKGTEVEARVREGGSCVTQRQVTGRAGGQVLRMYQQREPWLRSYGTEQPAESLPREAAVERMGEGTPS